jgi:hypothetical protein
MRPTVSRFADCIVVIRDLRRSFGQESARRKEIELQGTHTHTHIHPSSIIRAHNPNFRAVEGSKRLRRHTHNVCVCVHSCLSCLACKSHFFCAVLLDAFPNCEKRLLTSSCLSFCPSVRLSAWNNSASTGRIFIEFDIWVFFENLSRKFQFPLKSDKNNGYFTWRLTYIYDNISLNSS